MATYHPSGPLAYSISNLQVTSITKTSAKFTWTCNPPSASYYIYLYLNGVAVTPGNYLITTQTYYTISNLVGNSTYTMSVTGCNVTSGANLSNCGNVGLIDFTTKKEPEQCVYGNWGLWSRCQQSLQTRSRILIKGDGCDKIQYDKKSCMNYTLIFVGISLLVICFIFYLLLVRRRRGYHS